MHETQQDGVEACPPCEVSLRFLTKNLDSLGLLASAFIPCPTTSSYSTSLGRCEIQLLQMSNTRPFAGTRSRYSCVSCARNASSTCVHMRGTE